MQFNLSTIPPGSLIQNATLSLFANTQQNNGNIAFGPMYGSNNACDLLTITSPWTLATVNWNNQPSVTNTNAIALPTSTGNYQDYVGINVTPVIQNWINNPQNNYGWMMKIQTAAYYNSMIFASSNFADSSKHPALVICYSPVGINEVVQQNAYSLFPNPAKNIISVKSSLEKGEWITIEVTDDTGRKLSSIPTVFLQNNIYSIDISRYAKGTYFVQLKSAKGNQVLRFVKM
jgi:hypothetical protein